MCFYVTSTVTVTVTRRYNMAKTMLIRAPIRVYQEACKIASKEGVTVAQGLAHLIENKDTLIGKKEGEIVTLRRELAKKPKTVTKIKTVEKIKTVREIIKEFDLGACCKCGEVLHWNLDRSKNLKLLREAIAEAGFIHTGCG